MQLDSGVTGAMATLVSASVFSIGFLTTRVHQAMHRATDRANQIDDRMLTGTGFDPTWLDEQRQALRDAVSDQFPVLIVVATSIFAALVLLLAVIAGIDADLGDWPNPATLLAFAIAEAAIVWVGIADWRRVTKQLAERLDTTLLGRLEHGAALLHAAAKHASEGGWESEHRLREATRIGEELRTRTRYAWADAEALERQVRLVRHSVSVGGHWRGSDGQLAALAADYADLVKRDPLRHDWGLTRARLAELADEPDTAARAWIAAERVPHGRRFRQVGSALFVEPRRHETFARALEELQAEDALGGSEAETTFRRLVETADDKTADLGAWLEAIARAKLDLHELGFVDAAHWLGSAARDRPELARRAARVRKNHVDPAEQAHYAKWGVEPEP